MADICFHEQYTIKSGDNLTKIAKRKGYTGPGPLIAYPPNQPYMQFLRKRRSLDLILPGESLFVPYHPDLLKKIIATSEYLIPEVVKTANQLIQEEVKNKKELDEFLFKIDAVNFLANIGVGIASLTAQGMRVATMSADDAAKLGSDELIKWFVESRITIASNVTTMTVPAPEAPKKDFKFYIRHTLGPWNPSYWASVVAAIKEGDMDLYLYGSDAVAHRNSVMIKEQADRDIQRLKAKMEAAQHQLKMPFYNGSR